MKLFLVVENQTTAEVKLSWLAYVLSTLSQVFAQNAKFFHPKSGFHCGSFKEKRLRWHGAAFSLCSKCHQASLKCQETSKMEIFEDGIDFELRDEEKLQSFVSFFSKHCREESGDVVEKENVSGKYSCTPFARFCDIISSYFTKVIHPDAESSRCCVIIGKSPKTNEELNNFFGANFKWKSSQKYRNLCKTLNSEVQNVVWIDTNTNENEKSHFLENLLSSCRGIYLNLNKVVHPIIPLSTFLYGTLNLDNRIPKKNSEYCLKGKGTKDDKLSNRVVKLLEIGKLPQLDVFVTCLGSVSASANNRNIPSELHFKDLLLDGAINIGDLDVGNGYLLRADDDSSAALRKLSDLLVDKSLLMVFRDKKSEETFAVQSLHISSGHCMVMHRILSQSYSAGANNAHPSHPIVTSFPFAILEPWCNAKSALTDIVKSIERPRLDRLESLLSAVRQHDWSRLMQSPGRPLIPTPKRICSPEGPAVVPRSEEALCEHTLELYRGIVNAGHSPGRLASAVRHLVATVHRYSRYRKCKQLEENKAWTLAFINKNLKKDSEMMKEEHYKRSDVDNNSLLLVEFQTQLLIAFEVNSLDMEGLESEPNSQLVDWAADIMQTLVMLCPRQQWRDFLHGQLVEGYHRQLGRSLGHLFTELGQDPPACLPEDCLAESDLSFVGGLGASFQDEALDPDEERERTTASTASSAGRREREPLLRPDLGEQNSQASAVIVVTPHRRKAARPRRVSPRGRHRPVRGQSHGGVKRRPSRSRASKSPSSKRRTVGRQGKERRPTPSSPVKTPTKTGSPPALVVKGTPSHRSGQPRWERARKKAAEKSGGRIVVQESPQKPLGRELRRLRRTDSSSQGFERGEAWKVAMEDHEISLSQFVEINGLDVVDGDTEMFEGSKDQDLIFIPSDTQSQGRHSNLFANWHGLSPKKSTITFSPPNRTSSPVKSARVTNGLSSPTKGILRTPVKGNCENVYQSPVKCQSERRRVLMSPRVRRRTFSGNEPAAAFLDEGTMFLDVREFTQLSATPDTSALGEAAGEVWHSPCRRTPSTLGDAGARNSARFRRRLFNTPDENAEPALSPVKVSATAPKAPRRLVFAVDEGENLQ